MKKYQTIENYNKKAKDYNKIRGFNPEIIKKLKSIFKKGTLLSLGCGSGVYERQLKKHKFKIVGIDHSKSMVNLTRKKGIKCFQGSITNMPMFKPETFDGTYEIRTIHHIGDNFKITQTQRNKLRQQAVNEAYRILKKDKKFVSVNADPIQNKALWFWYYFPEALKRKLKLQIKIADLKKWMRKSGFKNIKSIKIKDDVVSNMDNPKILLNKKVRNSISDFSYLSKKEVDKGIAKLNKELITGKAYKTVKSFRKRMNKLGGALTITSGQK